MNVMIYLSIMIKKQITPIELKYLNIHVFKKVDVGWGEDSQIECEMFLFNEAYKRGRLITIICYRGLISFEIE